MQVKLSSQEDGLEEEMATYSSIFAWKKSHGQKSLVGYSLGMQRVRHNWTTKNACYLKQAYTLDKEPLDKCSEQ